MKKFVQLLTLAALLCVPWATQAQNLSDYTVTTGTETYVSIADADSLLSSVNGDGGTQTVQLPFNFAFGETVYPAGTNVTVRADGYIYFGTTSPGHSCKSAWTATTNYALIAPLITYDGKITASGATSGAYKALKSDGNGNPMLVIEFKSVMCYYGDNGNYNYQVRLHHNGNISVVYGTNTATTYSSMVHNFFLINGTADKICLTGSFASPVASSTVSALPNLSTMPVSGQVITYNRPVISCPKPMTLDAVRGSDQMTLSWTQGGTETAWELVVGSNVYYPTTTSYTVNNLTPNTLYDCSVSAICGVGDTSAYRSASFRTECAPNGISSLPYFNDFEYDAYYTYSNGVDRLDAVPSCWTRINDATSTSYNFYPYLSNGYTYSGTVSMYWYNYTTSS